jgi:phage tail sheath protein FI
MPSALTYPGVYIEEIPSGVRTITGVATSITAFIGRTRRGPVDRATRVQSFADFARVFGGLWRSSVLSYAVNHFFQHGGTDALIVRVHNGAVSATGAFGTGGTALSLEAASPGRWGEFLEFQVDHDTRPEVGDEQLFNLAVRDIGTNATEMFRNISALEDHSRFVGRVLADESSLVHLATPAPTGRPTVTPGWLPFNNDGDDGDAITDAQVKGEPQSRTGLYALEEADLFNLLCIPPLGRVETDKVPNAAGSEWPNVALSTWAAAASYCEERRAMLLIDPREDWHSIDKAKDGVNDLRGAIGNDLARNAAVYFPRLRMPDPLAENRLTDFAPCGAIAGIIARTDTQRGIWKAPAGLDASFSGVRGLTYTMTDAQNGVLNPLGLNCIRTLPAAGHVVWGARTLVGADRLASEWKYLSVRRPTLFIEESLYRGTQWVVFEPNDEPLWSQIRLNAGAFMHNLFRQGAFQGKSPREAYFVACNHETTTQNDIDRGIVNIHVGCAPLKPAEFVVIRIQQMAGQIEV